MSVENPLVYLKHIRDECLFIMSIVKSDSVREEVFNDETTKKALVRSLEVIGEATKNIPADYKLKWNSISWK